MKSRQAKRIRAMRERMEKVVAGRVTEAGARVRSIEAKKAALEGEMRELQNTSVSETSAQELFVAASTLEKARRRVKDLSAKRNEAADVLLELESELHDARRATEMADRLCAKLRAADQARRDKLEQELSDDAGSRLARSAEKRGDADS